MFKLNCVCFRNEKQKDYKFLPQHFLNLRPLPQMQGSLRPIFGESLRIGVLGGQQLVSLQQASLSSIINVAAIALNKETSFSRLKVVHITQKRKAS